MTFSERLKEIREDNDYSRQDLAAAIHVTSAAISNYENGNREPDIKTLLQISDFLNVSVDYLIGLANANVPPKDMEKNYYKDVSANLLMSRLIGLSAPYRQLLISILDCIEMKQYISEKGKRK